MNLIYHVTYKQYIESIRKKGLLSKQGNLTSSNINRLGKNIYFWYNLQQTNIFIQNIFNDKKKLCIIEVDLDLLIHNKFQYSIYNSKIYNNTLKEISIYQNIPPKFINRIIKKI